MKVIDLIIELQKMPQDARVLHLWDGAPRTDIQIVYLAKNGDVITSDYGMVCYSDEDRPVDSPDEKEDRFWQTGNNPNPEDEEF